jgi:hypothetical protein
MTPAMKQLQRHQLAYTSKLTLCKRSYMSVKATQQHLQKKIFYLKNFSIHCRVDTSDHPLLFRKNSKWLQRDTHGPGETES